MLFLHLLAVILKDLRTIRAIHLPQILFRKALGEGPPGGLNGSHGQWASGIF
jgi:hypothetical protein